LSEDQIRACFYPTSVGLVLEVFVEGNLVGGLFHRSKTCYVRKRFRPNCSSSGFLVTPLSGFPLLTHQNDRTGLTSTVFKEKGGAGCGTGSRPGGHSWLAKKGGASGRPHTTFTNQHRFLFTCFSRNCVGGGGGRLLEELRGTPFGHPTTGKKKGEASKRRCDTTKKQKTR